VERKQESRKWPRSLVAVRSAAQIIRTHRWLCSTRANTGVGEAGYQVIGQVLTTEQCLRIRADADQSIHETLPDPATGAFVVDRLGQALAGDGYDTRVCQVMNYERIAPWVAEVLSPVIERVSLDQLGTSLYATNYSVQVDWPDSASKRPYHTDGFAVNHKLFVYLTDVDSLRNGPYTVIPGSHLAVFKKLANLVRNELFRRAPQPDDMHWMFGDSESVSFLERAGTGIFSCQALAHKGWQEHSERKRYMLVVYLSRNPAIGPSGLGREWMVTEPIAIRA
jgi:hypothetical protein